MKNKSLLILFILALISMTGVFGLVAGYEYDPWARNMTGNCTGQLVQNVTLNGVQCVPYSAGTGTVTSIQTKMGLNRTTITDAGNISVNFSETQMRVSGVCDSDEYMYEILENGSVLCAQDSTGSGTVTQIDTGYGLTGGSITISGTIAIDGSFIQMFNQSPNITNLLISNGSLYVLVDSLNLTKALAGTCPANYAVQNATILGHQCVALSSGGNASWNESYANTLYYSILNPQNFINVSNISDVYINISLLNQSITSVNLTSAYLYIRDISNNATGATSYNMALSANTSIPVIQLSLFNTKTNQTDFVLALQNITLLNQSLQNLNYSVAGLNLSLSYLNSTALLIQSTLTSLIQNHSSTNATAGTALIIAQATNGSLAVIAPNLYLTKANQSDFIVSMQNITLLNLSLQNLNQTVLGYTNGLMINQSILNVSLKNLNESVAGLNASNALKASTGNCAVGYLVQNTTTSGVQCMPASAGTGVTSLTAGAGVLADGIGGASITTTGTISLNETVFNNITILNNSLKNLNESVAGLNASNALKALAGNCPSGQVLQNATTSGVQCITASGTGTVSSITLGTGYNPQTITSTGTINLNGSMMTQLSSMKARYIRCELDSTATPCGTSAINSGAVSIGTNPLFMHHPGTINLTMVTPGSQGEGASINLGSTSSIYYIMNGSYMSFIIYPQCNFISIPGNITYGRVGFYNNGGNGLAPTVGLFMNISENVTGTSCTYDFIFTADNSGYLQSPGLYNVPGNTWYNVYFEIVSANQAWAIISDDDGNILSNQNISAQIPVDTALALGAIFLGNSTRGNNAGMGLVSLDYFETGVNGTLHRGVLI